MSDQSITLWIEALKVGNSQAAEELWEVYFNKLVGVARNRLHNAPKRIADEEDVAISVFRRLCDMAERSSFQPIQDRDDLWRFLLRVTANRVIDIKRKGMAEKRGGGRIRGESVFQGSDGEQKWTLDQHLSDDPTPEFLATLGEQQQRLMAALPEDRMRQIALWRMEGFSNEQIASKLDLTTRSVERKLKIIREIWSSELD